MPGWLKIILVIFGVFALVVVGLSVTGYYWFRTHGGELRKGAEKLRDDGKEFGKGKTVSACVDESLVRLKRAPGIVDQVRTQIFYTSCAETAAPSPELCNGIPAEGELLARGRWAAAQCANRGMPQSQGCAQLFTVVAGQCRKSSM